MRRLVLTALVSALVLGGCVGKATDKVEKKVPEETLQIVAAASLKDAFADIAREFERENPGVKVSNVFDGSTTLVQQLSEGFKADVFASADKKNMDKAVERGLVDDTASRVFATNQITAAVPAANPGQVKGLVDLAKRELKVVVCAPEVPCGNSTGKVLKKAGLQVTPVSQEQNVKAVSTKLASGEADAGFIYRTDVKAANGKITEIPTEVDADLLNKYPIAELKQAEHKKIARAFIKFVIGEKAQKILQGYGFGKP
ncbi:MAG: molybdate ABC transporter substrate-binding protein [Actinomycetaceae bacterium]|nr:molybdate ABC transporter substrate-binding protein [Actinomycetaceae bacterium]